MNNLYEKVDFILSGGALRPLVEFLTPKVSAALIVSPKDEDLEIVDAVGTKTEGLFLKGWAHKLASAFPGRVKEKKFEISSAALEGEWPWAVCVRGMQWTFYILLREAPGEAMLEELSPIAGLIALWQAHQHIEVTEKRLSQMAYMILAAKNTLASIFEPMPLNYYASFLTDVLHESFFPKSLSIFRDSGGALSTMVGDAQPPAREGIYAQTMLPPAPIITKKGSPCEIVLPIIEPYRLFCVATWDKMPEEETLDFLELVSNLASRALSINCLKAENTDEKDKISSGEFTILSLAEALNALKGQKDRQALMSMAVDIVSELAHVDECFAVAWDGKLNGYAPVCYIKNGAKAKFGSTVLTCDAASDAAEPQVYDLGSGEFAGLLKLTEPNKYPWPEMSSMKMVFPLWVQGRMEGFIAISHTGASSPLADGNKLSALKIVAQFTALVMKRFA